MCDWCEPQYDEYGDAEPVHFQESGEAMSIWNTNILGVEGPDGTVISYTEISYCPNCGRDLFA